MGLLKRFVAMLLCIVSSTWPSAAAAQETASFTLNGVRFDVPIQTGYCLPTGPLAALDRMMAEADTRNVTHLSLFRCGDVGVAVRSYFIIKTPRNALTMVTTLEALLAGLDAAFSTGPLSNGVSGGQLSDMTDRFSSSIGSRVDLTGQVRPLGRDAMCAYLGGTMTVQTEAGSEPASLGACITAIADRPLMVTAYGDDQGSPGIVAL